MTTVQKKDHSRAENISNQHPAEIEKHHRPPIVLLSEKNPPRSEHRTGSAGMEKDLQNPADGAKNCPPQSTHLGTWQNSKSRRRFLRPASYSVVSTDIVNEVNDRIFAQLNKFQSDSDSSVFSFRYSRHSSVPQRIALNSVRWQAGELMYRPMPKFSAEYRQQRCRNLLQAPPPTCKSNVFNAH